MTTPSVRERIERASKNYEDSYVIGPQDTSAYDYRKGAEFGYRLAIEMLRSEEAEEKPKPFNWNFVIEKTFDTGQGWATWLEEKLK
jgi:hypothetical protein